MKITIEFDPATLTTKVTPSLEEREEGVTPAVSRPAAPGKALDAGACVAGIPGEKPAPAPSTEGQTATPAGPPPPVHPDWFGPPARFGRTREGLDAGIFRG